VKSSDTQGANQAALDDRKIKLEEEKLKLDQERLRFDVQVQNQRLVYEFHKLLYDANRPHTEAAFKFADAAIRSLLILNGGAALAVISFAVHAQNTATIAGFSEVVLYFGSGAALAVACAGLSYLAQNLYLDEARIVQEEEKLTTWTKTRHVAGHTVKIAAILALVFGLSLFVAGVWQARGIFSKASQPISRHGNLVSVEVLDASKRVSRPDRIELETTG